MVHDAVPHLSSRNLPELCTSWLLPHGELLFTLGIVQEALGFVTCDVLLEKVWIIVCCFSEFITDPYAVIACSWYIAWVIFFQHSPLFRNL